MKHIKPTSFNYSQAVEIRDGRTVFIAGQVPVDEEGNLVGEGDVRAQMTQVFENLKSILTEVGADFNNVAKFTIFLTDMGDIQHLREVRDQYINVEKPPASSLIQVVSLYRPEVMVEIEAVAFIPD